MSETPTKGDPFHPVYKIVLDHFSDASMKVEVTGHPVALWWLDVRTKHGTVVVQWNVKLEKYGVSDVDIDPHDYTHKPDLVFDTPGEAGGAVVGLLWRKEAAVK